ncbi:response regulator transcription factor [Patescibacteria group bacterium]|nr:response regulator transcription factor [Patescibacteria group bacterium]
MADNHEFAHEGKQLEVNRKPPHPPVKTAIVTDDNSERTTLLLCQRNEKIRSGLTKYLNVWDVDVLGQTDNAIIAWNMVQDLQPSVVVIDVELDGEDGLSLCKRIHSTFPDTYLVVYTDTYNASRYCHRLRRAGAKAIILKSSPFSYWSAVIQFRNENKEWLDPKLSDLVAVSPFSELGRQATKWREVEIQAFIRGSEVENLQGPELTERIEQELRNAADPLLSIDELEALVRLSMTDDEIAEELDWAVEKVKTQLEVVLKKLNLTTRPAAILACKARGLRALPKMLTHDETGKTWDDTEAERNAQKVLDWD